MDDLVTFGEVAALAKLSKRSLKRLWTCGRFPRPRYLSARRLVWRRRELDQFLDQAGSPGDQAAPSDTKHE